MELLKMLEQKSYTVKELSAEAYNELLKMFDCCNINDLLYCEEQLLEQGLKLESYSEEVSYNENSENYVSYHSIYLLDKKNMVKYIVNDYFE